MDDESRRDARAMGRLSSGPRPLGGLADLAELLGGNSDRSRRLLGGLAIGALAGAAVAGALLRARTVRGRGSRRP